MSISPPARADLPIDELLPEICRTLDRRTRCLLVAQPGAGKTTRVPLALLRSGSERGRWLLLEPRRVAARLAAEYMAQQLGESVGETVGYRVRGESRVGSRTRLEVVTQGILTRLLQDDPALEGVEGIIFDEFHERSLEADLGLALALDVQTGLREDLKLLIMSATLDVASLLAVLGEGTPVLESRGRSWPVTTCYRPATARQSAEIHQAQVVREALGAQQAGHILVFLPGQREIRRLQTQLESRLPAQIELCPLHGQLPLARQQAVLRPPAQGRRRIILASAIAESSLTVPGVNTVIDTGRERLPVFQPRSGLTRLQTRQVNRASADQRRGRAGREAPGLCYRLWAEDQRLMAHREAEVLQADLAGLVFELVRWGVTDPWQLAWVTAPPKAALASARGLLQELGLLREDGTLSGLGQRSSRWPSHPRLAVLLESAAGQGQLPLACWLVAWLEEAPGEREIDIARLLAQRPQSDGAGSMGRWWRAARQWARRACCGLDITDTAAAAGLLARAYPDRLAQNQGGGRFRLVTGGQALLPEQHPLTQAEFLVAVELDGQASGARIYHAIAMDRAELERIFPAACEWREDIRWEAATGRLLGEEVRGPGALVLERRKLPRLPAEAVSKALLQAVRQRGELRWSPQDRQLLGRLRLLHATLGGAWPDAADTALLASLEQWLLPYLDKVNRLEQLDRLPLGQFLLHRLDWSQQQQLEQLAPTHLDVPSGARIRLDYSGQEVVLAVKLQEMFGQAQTPRLVNGRVPVLLHLLSPARRPVQVTRDLASFWAATYFEVRKDLKGRYPRHPWPDDPLQAQATHHTHKPRHG